MKKTISLFGRAVNVAFAVLHSREVFIWKAPGYHYFIRSDAA